MDQWGHSYFGHLPHWPFPPLSMCCLTDPLQGTGVGCKPEWVIYALQNFFPGHKLPDVESSQSRRANVPPLNLDTPSPHCEEVLSQQQGCTFCPHHQRDDEFTPGYLIIQDALDCQLKPAGGSPGRVDGLQHGLLLTNIHLVTCLQPWTSPGRFRPFIDEFSVAIILPPYYAMDWCVWGLEIIFPGIVIIKGDPGHSLTGVTGLGMGRDINHLGQFEHGVGTGGCSCSAVAPQRHTGVAVTLR